MLRRAVQLPPLAERGARERHRRPTSSRDVRDMRVAANLRRAQDLSDITNWTVLVFNDILGNILFTKSGCLENIYSNYSDSNRSAKCDSIRNLLSLATKITSTNNTKR